MFVCQTSTRVMKDLARKGRPASRLASAPEEIRKNSAPTLRIMKRRGRGRGGGRGGGEEVEEEEEKEERRSRRTQRIPCPS